MFYFSNGMAAVPNIGKLLNSASRSSRDLDEDKTYVDASPESIASTSGSQVSFLDKRNGVCTIIQNAKNVQYQGTMNVYMGSSEGKSKKIKHKKPLTTSKEPYTKDQMLDLKDRIHRNWRDLGRRLGFEDSVLDQLHYQNQHDLCELNYQILLKWKQEKPNDATKENLARIFAKIHRGDLADYLADSS